MLGKRIKDILIKILVGTLIVLLIYIGGKLYLGNKYNNSGYMPKSKQEAKMDLTQFKIKQILNTNKIQSMEVTFSSTLEDSRWDHCKNVKELDGLFKLLTSRKLEITGDYKALFTYDLSSNTQFTDNKDGTYTITLNKSNINLDVVQMDTPKTKEKMSSIGRYYSSDIVSDLTYQLQKLATDKINTDDNKIKAIQNTRYNLSNLLENFGLNTNKIKIIIEGV